ncbi:MAG: Sec-independent protein translocase protein TatB [Rhodospirillales bacterium]|jgi:sec-independent protein translocase protein TatB|nr:Sec-independent protein translocase protein TatB [Rhodospirillales bacterium]MDP6882842.1 Sec-independent protein translocase protein TatB [Rhodospirillales bacterium]
MFDIGWQELFIVAVLVVIVVGPKDLPRTLRAIMGWVRKARTLAREFQDGVDDVVRQADLDDIKKQVTEAGDMELDTEIKKGLGLAEDFDADALESDVEDALSAVPDAAQKPALEEPVKKTRPRARKAARKTPAGKKKTAPSVRKSSPAKAATVKKSARPAKAGKSARPKKAAARRPARGRRAPTKSGA